MKRIVVALVLVVGTVAGGFTSPASAAGLAMDVGKKAQLVDGGQAALVQVVASCPAGAELLEAFVYVNQDGNSTQFGPVRIPCDGAPHRVTSRVTALDFTLHKGKATASGYMLLTSGESISPTFSLKLK